MLNGSKDEKDESKNPNPGKWIQNVLSNIIYFGSGLLHIHLGTSFTAFDGLPLKETTQQCFQIYHSMTCH